MKRKVQNSTAHGVFAKLSGERLPVKDYDAYETFTVLLTKPLLIVPETGVVRERHDHMPLHPRHRLMTVMFVVIPMQTLALAGAIVSRQAM